MATEALNSDRADRVLEAAFQVFCESGYRASIDLVAARAGVARQTIYNHFGSKQALFESTLAGSVADMLGTLGGGDVALRERLLAFAGNFRQRVLSPDAINLHRVLTSEAPRFSGLAQDFYRNCIQHCAGHVAEQFEIAMQQGLLRRENPQRAAMMLLDMLASQDRTRMLFGGAAPDPAGEAQLVEEVVDFFLRAMKP
ncbi:TetR/AcrR family transcriptional regulator [Amantichitinum ursilacus]|uniref:Bacterial regulatory protein, tetR family n=1 Tax=Amantichitinum ursilacus TaxID=857265 RepID=A0A0N0XGW2_9NEIS|nr:TetR/AcrR family transcriptional regulator [Amantichitinum ursilacus]KPC50543.1 Bacterial regulatory protein, tetR family [Amantichitinum ursilacus]